MRKTTENFPQVLFIYKHKYKMDNLYKKFSIWVLIISPLLVYWPTFSNQFQMHWDDWWVVMNDYTENGINKDNLIQIFVQFYHGQYAPLNETYYLLLYNIFGYNAFVFHFASLLIHMCNVVLVFFLIKRLLQFSFSLKASSVLRVSFITALLMSIHPFSVEPVAWIAASKCLLYTLFYLLALHTYLSFIIKQKWFFYVSTLFLFVLSFGSKEQAITLPGCLLLFDFITKRSIRNTTVWLEKLPFLIFAFVFIVVTFLSQKQNVDGILSHSITYPWYQNVVFASYCLIEYFFKCIVPLRLSFIYPFPNLPGESLPLKLLIYPATFVCLFVGFWKIFKTRWVAFGLGFFLIQAIAFSNLIPTSRYAIMADRYVYLASVGVYFLIAYSLDFLLLRYKNHNRIILAIFFIYVICLGTYANERCKVWKDSNTLKKEIRETLKSREDYNWWMKKYNLEE